MGLSPAVVSKRISLLEERLGARLFQRTTRQLTLTDTGEGYFRRIVDILSMVEEAEDFVSRRNTKPRGLLKVTAPTSFARMHLAPSLNDFLAKFPEVELDLHLTDHFVDIIRDGFDLAVRIGELPDSSLVARKLAPDTRVLVAAPSYLARMGEPKSLAELEGHNCMCAGAQDGWRLDGPEGPVNLRVKGNIRSDSADFLREALVSGLGIGLRSTWDIKDALIAGKLKIVLPQYRGSSNYAIYAVYPCRDYMPEKVNVFIEFLAGLFSGDLAWNTQLKDAAVIDFPSKPGAGAGAVSPSSKRKPGKPRTTASK